MNLRESTQGQGQTDSHPKDKRDKRCCSCRSSPHNRECFNDPVCDRCVKRHQGCTSSKHLYKCQFLDWHYWLSMCQELVETSNTNPLMGSAQRSSPSINHNSIGPIILDILFTDRLREGNFTSHTVVFHPDEQNSTFSTSAQGRRAAERPPALDLNQLDDLVRLRVWGSKLWKYDDINLPIQESKLWDSVRLFLGYYSMMQNLTTTYIQSTDIPTTNILGRIVAELIYAFGWRLQMLYFGIATFPYPELLKSGKSEKVSPVRLYSLEVLCRFLDSAGSVDWKVPRQNIHHPLTRLQQHFKERAEQLACQFHFIDCFESGLPAKSRQLRPIPAMIEFVRSLPSTGFPKHCHITVSRNNQVLRPLIPCDWQTGIKYLSTEIVAIQRDDIFNLGLHDPNAHAAPRHIVTEENKRVPFTISRSSSATNVLMVANGTESLLNTSTESNCTFDTFAVGPVISQSRTNAMSERAPSPTSSSNCLNSPENRSAVTSLVTGSPLSFRAPETPLSVTTIPGYQEDQQNL